MSLRTVLRGTVLILSCASGGACGSSEASPSRDGSALTEGAAEAGPGRPSATDYADVTIEQDFIHPFSLPPPSTTFQGDAAILVGVWDEVFTLPSVTVGGAQPSLVDGGTCGAGQYRHLEIQQDATGAVHGTIRIDASPSRVSGSPMPFAPATDPNVGYPTTLSPDQYFAAEEFCPNVDYRVFDPVFANGTLSFWFSPLDLWTDWCALQTPFAWSVRGQTKYACVPQTADASATDFGKLVLCSNANDGPLCTEPGGRQGPCVCLDDAGYLSDGIATSPSQPLCSNSVCECTETECHALVRSAALSAILTLNTDELTGPFADPQVGPDTVVRTLRRRAHP